VVLGAGGGFPPVRLGGYAGLNLPWFVEHISTPQQAFNLGLDKILPNLLLALVLALLFGFFSTLQGNVMEEHEREIAGWFAPITGPLGSLLAAGAALDANLSEGGLRWLWQGALYLWPDLFVPGSRL
jgi:hypothetical protein